MSDANLKYITDSLLKTYANSSLINEEYIANLLQTLKEENILNDNSQVIFTCKSMINNYLVEQAKMNEDILLELVFDMASVKERICLKLKLDVNNFIYDDYLMEGILSYDGSKSLDLYLSSFLMQKVKMKYVPEKTNKKLEYKSKDFNNSNSSSSSEPKKVVEVTPVIGESKKVLNEATQDNLGVKNSLQGAQVTKNEEAIKEESVIEVPKEEIKPVASILKEEAKKQLKNKKRREAKRTTKKDDIEIFETSIEDLEDLLNLPKDEEQNKIEDITKDLCEPLEQRKISGEELAKRVSKFISTIKGTEEENLVMKLYKFLDAEKKINGEDNIIYWYYSRLRFGTYNGFYSLDEIALVLDISLDEVISYEEYTIKEIKELLGKRLEKNISLIYK